MTTLDRSTMDRRRVVASGGVAAFAALLAHRTDSSADSVRTGGGIAGGGWVSWDGGEAQFSLFASTFTVVESDAPVIFGSFNWVDAAGFSLTSTQVVNYFPIEGEENARLMQGFLTNSTANTSHAFELKIVEDGGPGSGEDTLTLLVGPEMSATSDSTPVAEVEGEAVFSFDGPIAVGDIQLLVFDFPAE